MRGHPHLDLRWHAYWIVLNYLGGVQKNNRVVQLLMSDVIGDRCFLPLVTEIDTTYLDAYRQATGRNLLEEKLEVVVERQSEHWSQGRRAADLLGYAPKRHVESWCESAAARLAETGMRDRSADKAFLAAYLAASHVRLGQPIASPELDSYLKWIASTRNRDLQVLSSDALKGTPLFRTDPWSSDEVAINTSGGGGYAEAEILRWLDDIVRWRDAKPPVLSWRPLNEAAKAADFLERYSSEMAQELVIRAIGVLEKCKPVGAGDEVLDLWRMPALAALWIRRLGASPNEEAAQADGRSLDAVSSEDAAHVRARTLEAVLSRLKEGHWFSAIAVADALASMAAAMRTEEKEKAVHAIRVRLEEPGNNIRVRLTLLQSCLKIGGGEMLLDEVKEAVVAAIDAGDARSKAEALALAYRFDLRLVEGKLYSVETLMNDRLRGGESE